MRFNKYKQVFFNNVWEKKKKFNNNNKICFDTELVDGNSNKNVF